MKLLFIEDLEWFVMTPVLMQQFRLFDDTREADRRRAVGAGR